MSAVAWANAWPPRRTDDIGRLTSAARWCPASPPRTRSDLLITGHGSPQPWIGVKAVGFARHLCRLVRPRTFHVKSSSASMFGIRRHDAQKHREESAMVIDRRTVMQGMLTTVASLATLKIPAVLAQGAPFKIGLLTVKTGPLAQGGIQMEQGISTLLKEKGNALAGRNIELLVADTGGSPAGAKTKTQELIERDKV